MRDAAARRAPAAGEREAYRDAGEPGDGEPGGFLRAWHVFDLLEAVGALKPRRVVGEAVTARLQAPRSLQAERRPRTSSAKRSLARYRVVGPLPCCVINPASSRRRRSLLAVGDETLASAQYLARSVPSKRLCSSAMTSRSGQPRSSTTRSRGAPALGRLVQLEQSPPRLRQVRVDAEAHERRRIALRLVGAALDLAQRRVVRVRVLPQVLLDRYELGREQATQSENERLDDARDAPVAVPERVHRDDVQMRHRGAHGDVSVEIAAFATSGSPHPSAVAPLRRVDRRRPALRLRGS